MPTAATTAPAVSTADVALMDLRMPVMDSPAPDDGGVPQAFAHLTAREIDVLRHLAGGASNAEIGQARVLAKLGVRDRVQAVVQAYEMGLVRAAGRRDN